MHLKKTTILSFILSAALQLHAQERPIAKESFALLNLNYPGLEKVSRLVAGARYNEAAAALLDYYREKAAGKEADFSNAEKPADIHEPIDSATREMADKALLHQFKPHKGYGFFPYGQDINWQFWPVKDNEVRWQLHRVKWWQSLALVYHATKDERYANEWFFEFSDWARKNPLGLSADNDSFAWRPLEISDRIQSLVPTLSLFLTSPNMTPGFLVDFLNSYHQQADYLNGHFAQKGNHRLFEAQRTLFAGASFPEFKNAPGWRKHGIEVLNTEINKQVFPDGLQFELSPVYHVASIDIFLKAYRAAMSVHLEKEFPESYKKTVENMIMANIHITFPDYNAPMFGDSWLINKKDRIKQYRSWSEVFPKNDVIRYWATEGREGKLPAYFSKGLTHAGFYTFRNGWTRPATILILKAGPSAGFHSQPDNGTFELWVKGRNFTPDAGVYVYSGDAEIMKLREAYRQTRVHQTLTLDNRNQERTHARLHRFSAGNDLDVLSYTNPSYGNLEHRRSVLFIDRQYFLIIDKAAGSAKGTLDVHFTLKEDSRPLYDTVKKRAVTRYPDGNNLLIQNLNSDKVALREEEGKVSYAYRQEQQRPAFAFEKTKGREATQTFVTVLYPFEGETAPPISLKEQAGNDFASGRIRLSLTIGGREKTIRADLGN
ncbi:heparin-sulfate lyase HepC [Paraflavisolibacter sp. H34]|uniref:heparin-sulfate lyase HepC n=1 Tax=Huijunlia imazamoxiresistens TaxID=3127457 RepID=UPI0030179192